MWDSLCLEFVSLKKISPIFYDFYTRSNWECLTLFRWMSMQNSCIWFVRDAISKRIMKSDNKICNENCVSKQWNCPKWVFKLYIVWSMNNEGSINQHKKTFCENNCCVCVFDNTNNNSQQKSLCDVSVECRFHTVDGLFRSLYNLYII